MTPKFVLSSILSIFFTANPVFADQIEGADIFLTPTTGSSVVDGYVGGDLPNNYDWCMGNRVPFVSQPTEDIIFSTNINDYLNPDDWKERVRITKDGKVGIGTPIPDEKLVVEGAIESTDGGFKFPDGTTQTTAVKSAAFQVYDTTHEIVLEDGVNLDLVFTSIEFDTLGAYNPATGHYTPQIAGMYNFFITGSMDDTRYQPGFGDGPALLVLTIKKNGEGIAEFRNRVLEGQTGTSRYETVSGNRLLHMNGTTDYISFKAIMWDKGGLKRKLRTGHKGGAFFGGFLVVAD